jgi:hypothetical protein
VAHYISKLQESAGYKLPTPVAAACKISWDQQTPHLKTGCPLLLLLLLCRFGKLGGCCWW